jgi:iron complex transport system substrate-binding protein
VAAILLLASAAIPGTGQGLPASGDSRVGQGLPANSPASGDTLTGQGDAVEVIDDLGQRVKMDSPAERIIALYGAYNEILAAMGLEDRIVGRTRADTLPPSILSRPSIGTHMRPNVEMVLGLKPDLILQEAGRREALMTVQQLKREGLSVAVFHTVDFARLFSVIRRLGVLTGNPAGARRLVSSLRARLDAVQGRLEGIKHRPSVFFEVRYPNLLGAGRGSMVNDIIRRAGGSNCIAVEKKFVRMDMEALIACDPEVYIVQRGPMNESPGRITDRPLFDTLRSVRQGRVMEVDEQIYSRPGPRSVEAVEQLARFLHPSLWSEDKH